LDKYIKEKNKNCLAWLGLAEGYGEGDNKKREREGLVYDDLAQDEFEHGIAYAFENEFDVLRRNRACEVRINLLPLVNK
jgi:hypothetical protein